MNGKTCPSCKYDNDSANYFCTQCGSKLLAGNDFQAKLCILLGEPLGALFLLRKGRTTIGHDCGNLIVLGDDLISNKHAMITFEDNGYWIEDRHSKNGIYLNGEKIGKKRRLYDGTIIKMGSTVFRFEEA